MIDITLIITASLVLILQIVMLLRKPESNDRDLNDLEKDLLEQFSLIREEARKSSKEDREELSGNLQRYQDAVLKRITESSGSQKEQLETFTKQLSQLTEGNEKRLDKMRTTLENKVKELQEGNEKKLDEMRKIVDEKLQETLQKRIGESFKLVSDNLERVQKGLGEMQNLATSVGGLKRVLEDVRARGAWGEIQLGSLLNEILVNEQYEENIATVPGSAQRVEFAIKLPGQDDENPVWLPVDAKFPLEKYSQVLEAYNSTDSSDIGEKIKELSNAVRKSAKDISEKYISPPYTTNFAIMFLPVEGLYAEVLRIPGLAEKLQHDYRVVLAGPTTLAALLNSLQMGFRTLAIEKRSGEVWKLLGAVRTEFGKFGDMLDKVDKNLETAANNLRKVTGKTTTIKRKLKDVQELPANETAGMLGDSTDEDIHD